MAVTDRRRTGATGRTDGCALFPSPLGPVVVAFNPGGISALDLADDTAVERLAERLGRRVVPARPPRRWTTGIARAIEEGAPGDLPLDLDDLTPFRRMVLALTATIPRGEVRPYAWLAAGVGRPRAYRAVGSAMAANPIPLIVPCHRVVRSDGTLGRYSLGGPDAKATLLGYEGHEKGERGRSLRTPSTYVSTFSS